MYRHTAKYHVKTLFLSDIHLGTHSCHAEELLEFIDNIECKQLILVGDILDLWAIKRKRMGLKDAHVAIIERFLQLAKQGTEIIYITGNHDEGFRQVLKSYPFEHGLTNIKLCNRYVFRSSAGKNYVVVHGDQFDKDVRCHRLISWMGDTIYSSLLFANRWWNRIRIRHGHSYWSLASAVKSRSKKAMDYIAHYEQAAIQFAQRKEFDGIICGHIHVANNRVENGVHYLNTGDWQDSCTAIIEHNNGELELLNSPQWLRSRANDQVLLARVS